MKFIFILLATVMAYFTAVQYNDPDSWYWIIIYGVSVILHVMAAFKRYPLFPLVIVAIGYLMGAIILLPSVFEWITKEHGENLMQKMSDDKMYIEETRECLGLMIAFIFILVPLMFSIKQKRKNKHII